MEIGLVSPMSAIILRCADLQQTHHLAQRAGIHTVAEVGVVSDLEVGVRSSRRIVMLFVGAQN